MTKNNDSTPRARRLEFENLENRELLSVSPIMPIDDVAETRNVAIYGTTNTIEPIKFTLPEEFANELSNAVGEPYKLAQPKISTATSTTKTISVEWNAISDAVDYNVMYRISTDKTFTTVEHVTGTTFTITNLTPSASYYVKVVAKGDGVDTLDSVDTSSKTVKTQALKALAQPKISTFTATTNSIEVNWNSVADAVNYDVMYRKSTDKAYTTVENVSATNYKLENLDAGSSYYFKIVANGDNEVTKDSADTSSKTIKTVALQKLATPKVTAGATTTKSIEFSWTAVSGAVDYDVQYRISSDKEFTTVEHVANTNFSLTNLVPGSSYYVKVIANGDNLTTQDSAASSAKTIKTVALKALT